MSRLAARTCSCSLVDFYLFCSVFSFSFWSLTVLLACGQTLLLPGGWSDDLGLAVDSFDPLEHLEFWVTAACTASEVLGTCTPICYPVARVVSSIPAFPLAASSLSTSLHQGCVPAEDMLSSALAL